MKTKEYLEKLDRSDKVAVILAKAVKNEFAPGYHPEYEQYQTSSARDWIIFCNSSETFKGSIILNDHQPPIDWLSGDMIRGDAFQRGGFKCLLVVGKEAFELLCPDKEDRDGIERGIEERLHMQ